MIQHGEHTGEYNLIYNDIEHLYLDGIAIFDDWHREESHFAFEHFLGGKDGIITRSIDDVEKFPNEIFYFVYVRTFDVRPSTLSEILSENTTFSKQFIKLLTSSNVRVLLVDFHEIDDPGDIHLLESKLKSLDVTLKNVSFINNDSNLEFFKKKYGWEIDLYKTNHLITNTCRGLVSKEFPLIEQKPGSFFLCKNRVGKPHRISTLSFLKKEKLIEHTNFSLLKPKLYDSYAYEEDSIVNELNINEYISDFITGNPIHTKWEVDRTDFYDETVFVDYAGDTTHKDYSDSYINITTESVFDGNNIHISEKSSKPFAFYQLPLFIASQYHVKTLKEYYEFDLFDDLIDHSYDNESDNTKRFVMITEEIKRLYNNRDSVKEYYVKNKKRLEYNRNRCIELSKKGIDFDVFTQILNK